MNAFKELREYLDKQQKELLARELYMFLSHVDLRDGEFGTKEEKEQLVWEYLNLKYPLEKC